MKEETREKRSETPPPQPPPHRQLHVPSSTTNTESTSPQTPSRRQFLTSNSIATPAVESAGIPRSVGTGEGVEEGKKPKSPPRPYWARGRVRGGAIGLAGREVGPREQSQDRGRGLHCASHLAQVPRKLNFLRQKAEPPTAASSSTPDTESKKEPSGGRKAVKQEGAGLEIKQELARVAMPNSSRSVAKRRSRRRLPAVGGGTRVPVRTTM